MRSLSARILDIQSKLNQLSIAKNYILNDKNMEIIMNSHCYFIKLYVHYTIIKV